MYAWHEKEYFAVAHGISGILLLLLMRPELLESKSSHFPLRSLACIILNYCSAWREGSKSGREIVQETIDWLMTTKMPSGNYPTRLDGESDRLVQWCHGKRAGPCIDFFSSLELTAGLAGAPAIGLLLHRAYEVYGKDAYLRGTS